MKRKGILTALLITMACLQTVSAQQQQGMKVWQNGRFKGYVVSSVDSIQFVNLATDVVLSQTEMALEIGESRKLTAEVYPDNVDKTVTWNSSNSGIASVDKEGTVTALSAGICTITCHVVDGIDLNAECQVKVGDLEGIPLSCAEAVQLATAMEDNATSPEIYTVMGYITEVVGNPSRNQQTFWMADTKDGGMVFEAYYANLPEGISAFAVGMKVEIKGKLHKFVSSNSNLTICEMKNADVVILEDGDNGGGGDDPVIPPVTDFVNGDFESWVSDTEPAGWKSKCTASSADLSKSSDAHSGSYACCVAGSPDKTKNTRLATQEITLEAGSYTFSFYARATTAEACQTRAGYVPVNEDGSAGVYVYNTQWENLSSNEWTQVSYDFELTEATTLCLIVMNPKSSSFSAQQDILVDDAALIKK